MDPEDPRYGFWIIMDFIGQGTGVIRQLHSGDLALIKDIGAHIVFVRLTSNLLDDAAEDKVAEIAVEIDSTR